jgi:thiol-disulfide isomerase/thioredoxin
MKRTGLTLVLSFIILSVFCQGRLDLSIKIAEDIKPNEIKVAYFNGRSDIAIQDSFVKRSLHLSSTFYTTFVALRVSFRQTNGSDDDRFFFVGTKPSIISIKRSPKSNLVPFAFTSINAINATDSLENRLYRDLFRARDAPGEAIGRLWATGQKVMEVDSLRKLQVQYFKDLNAVTLNLLKKHPNDYFAFWYFGYQVVNPSLSILRNDAVYLRWLISWFRETFPQKYQSSLEGRNMLQALEVTLDPAKANEPAPGFSKPGTNGKIISLNSLKGKYVLLDFWASWCGPCLASIPLLRDLDKKYSREKFQILGINIDQDRHALIKAVSENAMSWNQVHDLDNEISFKFGVLKIPTFILIDPAGQIIYRGTGLQDKGILAARLSKLLRPQTTD